MLFLNFHSHAVISAVINTMEKTACIPHHSYEKRVKEMFHSCHKEELLVPTQISKFFYNLIKNWN